MNRFRKIYDILTPPQRRQVAVLLLLTIFGMVLETLGVALVIPVIGLLTHPDPTAVYPQLGPVLERLGNPTPTEIAVGGMLGLIALHLVRVGFLGFLVWKQMGFAFAQQTELSLRLFGIYLRQPYPFHLNRNSAQLIQNAIGEVRLFAFSVTMPVMFLLTEGSVMVGMVALLLLIEPLGGFIVVLALAAAAALFQRAVRSALNRTAAARQYHEGQRLQHLQQGLSGVKDVKLLGREANFLKRYCFHDAQSAAVGRFQHTIQQFPRLWLELLAVAGLAGLVLTMVAQGRNVAAIVPTLGLFAAAAFRMMPSVNRFMAALQSLRLAAPVVDTLHAELQLRAPEPVHRAAEAPRFERELELRSVTYTYPGAAGPAVHDLSLAVRKGESVGFIGPSGSGKSTLVDLVLGLFTPDRGAVVVDGRGIEADPRAWQDQIGYVPQTIYLTDDTLRRNVAFGLADDQIDDAAVARAIAAAQLEAFVGSLPSGLETVVGERGVRLSGGQRQRVGIARALYHDPAVLVLDEATSALDTDTERGVMQAVTALQGKKTVLIVAHRLSTVAGSDRLYRLDGGRIVDEGTPVAMMGVAS